MRSKKSNPLTDFEMAVYAAVLDIPLGETRSYGWVAERIGRPRAARAVGNALRKNPNAPFVPCHRVIASDGSLGGYSGGLTRKRALLEREREMRRETRPKVLTRQLVNSLTR
jgi:methylated-DNA-[protein]-cysteine S-methyltransferase